LKARAVRVKVSTRVPASIGGRACELVDISVTGALTVVDSELEVGSRHPFQLGQEGQTLKLVARVVRVKVTNEHGRWQAGVAFEEVTPGLQRAISATVSRLMAAPPRRLPGHGP
jgi:c-di-GMP-binding flagellar brake protein YcgR